MEKYLLCLLRLTKTSTLSLIELARLFADKPLDSGLIYKELICHLIAYNAILRPGIQTRFNKTNSVTAFTTLLQSLKSGDFVSTDEKSFSAERLSEQICISALKACQYSGLFSGLL